MTQGPRDSYFDGTGDSCKSYFSAILIQGWLVSRQLAKTGEKPLFEPDSNLSMQQDPT